MTVRRIRLASLVVVGLLAVLAAFVARPDVTTDAELDRIDQQLAEAQFRKTDKAQPPPVTVTRRGAIACLRKADFTVHSAPERGFEVTGRGLPAGTVVRILGPGAPGQVPRGGVSWDATAQAIFTMAPFDDQTVRRAFFGCIDPPGSSRLEP